MKLATPRHPVQISNADGVVVLEGEVADVAAKKLALLARGRSTAWIAW